MSFSPLQQEPAYQFYYALLFRYARRIIKDAGAAASLVTEVLQEQVESRPLQLSKQECRLLKDTTTLRCFYWQQAQVFDRDGVKVERLRTNHNKHTK